MKNKILIFGCSINNTGAEALLYTSVYELKKRFPMMEVVVLMRKCSERDDLDNYKFIIEEDNKFMRAYAAKGYLPIAYLIELLQWRWKEFRTSNGKKKVKYPVLSLQRRLKDACFAIDISGNTLSSSWVGLGGELRANYYLLMIEACQKFGVPLYLMPQTFGPFDFSEKIIDRARVMLPKSKIIFTRESVGNQQLKEMFQLKNLQQACDLVLQGSHVEYEQLLDNRIIKDINIVSQINNVAIIPNMRLFDQTTNGELLLLLYMEIIDYLLANKKNVYLLRHSVEDIYPVQQIKNMYRNNPNVYIMEEQYHSYQFEEIIKNFEYVIASRYHAIVHSYKSTIPIIAIGWSDKYKELLSLFNQSEYYFDARKKIEHNKVIDAVGRMNNRYSNEKSEIKRTLVRCKESNSFQLIKENQNK